MLQRWSTCSRSRAKLALRSLVCPSFLSSGSPPHRPFAPTDAEDHASATRLLSSAAAYEDALRLQPAPAPAKPGDTQAQRRHMALRSQATMAYYKARMIAVRRHVPILAVVCGAKARARRGRRAMRASLSICCRRSPVRPRRSCSHVASGLTGTYRCGRRPRLIARHVRGRRARPPHPPPTDAPSPIQTDALARAILDIGKALLRPAPPSSQRTTGAGTGSQGAGSQPGGKPAPASRPAVDPRRARDAVDYLRRAYALVEKAEERDAAVAEGRQGDGVVGAGARAGLAAVKVGDPVAFVAAPPC
jgi:hypothetical protein